MKNSSSILWLAWFPFDPGIPQIRQGGRTYYLISIQMIVNRIESLNINWEIEAGQWITWKPKFSPNFPDFSFSD